MMKNINFILGFVLLLLPSCDSLSPIEYYKLNSEEVENVFDNIYILNSALNSNDSDSLKILNLLENAIISTEKASTNIENIGHFHKYPFLYKMTLMNLSGINDLLNDKYYTLYNTVKIPPESRSLSDIGDINFYCQEINDIFEYLKTDLDDKFTEFAERYEIENNINLKTEKLNSDY